MSAWVCEIKVELWDGLKHVFNCLFVLVLAVDNRWRIPRKGQANRDFSVFNTPDDVNYPRMAPQLMLATFQFLSTSRWHFSHFVMVWSLFIASL